MLCILPMAAAAAPSQVYIHILARLIYWPEVAIVSDCMQRSCWMWRPLQCRRLHRHYAHSRCVAYGRTFIPSVIEPSFGIGRIMYCLFEHAFYHREGDEKRTVFRFQPVVAPFKATVLPLLQKDSMNSVAQQLSAALTKAGLFNVIDTTGTVQHFCNEVEVDAHASPPQHSCVI